MIIYQTHDSKQKQLETMRADLSLHDMPDRLVSALMEYDFFRKQHGTQAADYHAKKHPGIARLNLGFSRITKRSGLALCDQTHLDKTYIMSHWGDLFTLKGAFYWNGDEKLTRRILLAAWKKGSHQ